MKEFPINFRNIIYLLLLTMKIAAPQYKDIHIFKDSAIYFNWCGQWKFPKLFYFNYRYYLIERNTTNVVWPLRLFHYHILKLLNVHGLWIVSGVCWRIWRAYANIASCDNIVTFVLAGVLLALTLDLRGLSF